MSRYLLLPLYAFMACGLMYCTQPDETLESIEEKVQPPISAAEAELLSQFDVYSIDGKVINDTDRVLAEVENAYVKLFDYPSRQLTLYTTEASYLRAVETDAELQEIERQRNIASAKAESEASAKPNTPVPQTEATSHYENFTYPDHSENLVFHARNGGDQYWTYGAPMLINMPDLNGYFAPGHYANSGSTNVSHGGWCVRHALNDLSYSNRFVNVRNSSRTKKRRLYFFEKVNYYGSFTSVYLGANSNVSLTTSNSRPSGKLAQSMWTDIAF